jgi:hypothetical protein
VGIGDPKFAVDVAEIMNGPYLPSSACSDQAVHAKVRTNSVSVAFAIRSTTIGPLWLISEDAVHAKFRTSSVSFAFAIRSTTIDPLWLTAESFLFCDISF